MLEHFAVTGKVFEESSLIFLLGERVPSLGGSQMILWPPLCRLGGHGGKFLLYCRLLFLIFFFHGTSRADHFKTLFFYGISGGNASFPRYGRHLVARPT